MRIKPLPPEVLTPELRFVHDEIASLVTGSQGPVKMLDEQGASLGREGVAELYFLIAGYSLIAIILNGFDMPVPEQLT